MKIHEAVKEAVEKGKCMTTENADGVKIQPTNSPARCILRTREQSGIGWQPGERDLLDETWAVTEMFIEEAIERAIRSNRRIKTKEFPYVEIEVREQECIVHCDGCDTGRISWQPSAEDLMRSDWEPVDRTI